MIDKRAIRSGCFDLVITRSGAQIRLNHYTQDDDGDILLTPMCVVYPELEYQVNEMISALTGILDELRKQGHTRTLSFPSGR